MAILQCDFFSDTMGMCTSMTVILPQKTTEQIGVEGTSVAGKYKTLWLLHGYSDDNTIWQRMSSIERYAAPLGIAVVMPNVHKSYYADMENGMPFWTFISKELPQIARSFFPLSEKREDNFIAGLSMGGYGALKLGLSFPELFCAAGSLSGVVELDSWVNDSSDDRSWDLIFGKTPIIKNSSNDLKWLIKNNKENNSILPELYQCCGTGDFLYNYNLSFKKYLEKEEISFTYEEEADFGDTWDYWDMKIQDYLKWLVSKQIV